MRLSEQEVFDAACAAVLADGRPGMAGAMCSYQTSTGARCAVGWLLSDDELADIIEAGERGSDVLHLNRRGLLPARLSGALRVLCQLQRAHDGAADSHANAEGEGFVAGFKRRAYRMAEDYGLSTAVLEA